MSESGEPGQTDLKLRSALFRTLAISGLTWLPVSLWRRVTEARRGSGSRVNLGDGGTAKASVGMRLDAKQVFGFGI